jgi:restriction endonuclease Mrr
VAVYNQPELVLVALGLSLTLFLVCLLLWYRRRQSWKLRVKTLGELLSLSPTRFELAVATLLSDLGYRDVKHVGQGGDLMADVTCRDKQGRMVVVQCKRHAPGIRVGSPDIQSFIGMMSVHHRTDQGIYVTTSEFSKPAASLAQEHGIRLINGEELSRLLQKTSRREELDLTR